jgi:hypothetical protein
MKIEIGSFYKTKIGNKFEFGIVDRLPVVDGVEMVSFLSADTFRWVGRLCRKEDMVEVEGEFERELALKSAIRFWRFEFEALHQRIEMQYADDDIDKLKELYKEAETWLHKLEE